MVTPEASIAVPVFLDTGIVLNNVSREKEVLEDVSRSPVRESGSPIA